MLAGGHVPRNMGPSTTSSLRAWFQPGLWRAGRDYWWAQAAIWGAYWLINALGVSSTYGEFLPWVTFEYLGCSLAGVLGTHFLRALIRYGGWLEMSPKRLAARAAVTVFLLGLLFTGIEAVSARYLPNDTLISRHAKELHRWQLGLWIEEMWKYGIMNGVWTLLYVGYHQRQRQQLRDLEFWQLRAALADAELLALRAQVNPHFLFNCLNGLRALVTVDPARAQDAVTRLSSLLRYALESGGQRTVPLSAEWHMVEDYLALESLRFDDALHVHIEIDPVTLAHPVPPMALQTLVENAVKHGFSSRPAVSAGAVEPISVRSWLDSDDGALLLEVVNAGTLPAASLSGTSSMTGRATTTGLGLINTRERLKRLFGPMAVLEISENPPGWITARLRVPWQVAEKAREAPATEMAPRPFVCLVPSTPMPMPSTMSLRAPKVPVGKKHLAA